MYINTYNNYIVKNSNHDIRIVKYYIKDKLYCLATNLFDKNKFSIDIFKMFYHKRWDIEEYFKLLKKSTNINKINENSIDNIKKTFVCYNIISKIIYLIKNYYNNQTVNNNSNIIKKINTASLINSLYKYDFFLNFFSDNFNENQLINFFKVIINYIYIEPDRTYLRICKRSNHLSYFKNYSIINKRLYK
jgi:hypothetical protein